jgi:hypothetical protein
MSEVNNGPQLVMNFELNAGGRFPTEMPDTSPTISNSSLTADAFNVRFDPIVIGDRRVRIREISSVKAGETVASHLTIHGPDGEQLSDEAGRSLAAAVLMVRWTSVLKGNLGPRIDKFVSKCLYQDQAGKYYETESLIEWEPLWIRIKSDHARALAQYPENSK